MQRFPVLRLFVLLLAISTVDIMSVQAAEWKAGAAASVITPTESMWMAGYGSRDKPSEGKLHDLWLKALAFQDGQGKRAVILSSDTLGIPQSIYNNTCKALQSELGLERSQIMFHASHTHCGPVLRGALLDIYPLDDKQRQLIEEYSEKLEKTIVQTVKAAFEKLQPATLSIDQGITRFAVNRRQNPEANVPSLREMDALQGPVDHSVPVLAVRSPEGELKAVVFGYACHNTTLSFYQWCGDYAGFAQMKLEDRHPGVVAMFTMGCGADQNPLPRRTVELCDKYGTMLADAVDDVLRRQPQPLAPMLETAYELVDLNLGPELTRQELEIKAAAPVSYSQRWAARLLGQMNEGKPFIRSYPYPVQVWRLGGKQWWITLGGEVVVDYSLKFKKAFGSDIWVSGYCNDVMAYIPSLRVLKEGGYEGASSMMVYGMPANRWGDDVEDIITNTVQRLVQNIQGQ